MCITFKQTKDFEREAKPISNLKINGEKIKHFLKKLNIIHKYDARNKSPFITKHS